MDAWLQRVADVVWGPVTVVLLVGTGVLMTALLGLVQLHRFRYAWQLVSGRFDNPEDAGEISHFQALSAALAATIGTGNIAGVGTAIAMGGPGAVFWMWTTAIFGMALKFSECLLALHFRTIHGDGTISAGPMYYLEKGLGCKWLARLFALFAVLVSFGLGNMAQANSVAEPVQTLFGVPKYVTGLVICGLVFAVTVGGIRRIGKVASRLVPFMSAFYVVGALFILARHWSAIPTGLATIVHDAFSGSAAAGGFAGAAVAQAVRFGVARGVFSNEAGLGSAPIAHGAARTKEPVREGLVAMLGPFVDTLVICTMTALVIITTGAYRSGLSGADLTARAFDAGLPGLGGYAVAISIIFFAFSTCLGWSYYGDRSIGYLFGAKFVLPYRVLFCLLLPVGASIRLELVWIISDIFNALMAWPNLVGLLWLSPLVVRQTRTYFRDPARMYADH
ncbi:alanine/glycine:cation symporter family protein [Syntrophotalea acetylenica]|uniref:Transporter n=1 Tax=Syntrophotalea acetylenica TaxID=29542 RepID=A0A1L3GIV9_SYNAC|nr:sodium:alanine symporter family protein [Syntrophotalea acetylenica]APG25862.1 transporter [Syntrophotalea acetylenica]APG43933.1 transporter [Syntrophotalea acetylenica]